MLPTNTSRIKVPCALLTDTDRIRKDYSHVNDLAESIRLHGQIQPVVITTTYAVVDGGSRLRAVRDVLKYEHVDVVFVETLDEPTLRQLEVEANIRRKDFTWTERVVAIAKVHELQVTTAIFSGRDRWTQRQTGELLGVAEGHLNSILAVVKLLRAGDKEVERCSGITEAIKLLYLRKERAAEAELAKRVTQPGVVPSILTLDLNKPLPSAENDTDFYGPSTSVPANLLPINRVAIGSPTLTDETPGIRLAPTLEGDPSDHPTIPLSTMLLLGDCLTHMSAMQPECIDHVITDIPYGIDMEMLDQDGTGMVGIDSVAKEHTVFDNIRLMRSLLPSVHRILKPAGFFIFFYDLEHHQLLINLAESTGFVRQRWPLTWVKTHSCKNQAAQHNFTKTTEHAMVLRKPNATLVAPQPLSHWTGSNDETRALLGHPFVKPLKLWQWIQAAVAIRGQTIYDPFAGVGSSTLAAIQLGLIPISSELNEAHYNRQVMHVSNLYSRLIPNVRFT